MDQGETYHTPELKKIGDVNELTQAFRGSGERGTHTIKFFARNSLPLFCFL